MSPAFVEDVSSGSQQSSEVSTSAAQHHGKGDSQGTPGHAGTDGESPGNTLTCHHCGQQYDSKAVCCYSFYKP